MVKRFIQLVYLIVLVRAYLKKKRDNPLKIFLVSGNTYDTSIPENANTDYQMTPDGFSNADWNWAENGALTKPAGNVPNNVVL